jgi:cell division protein FtsQ
MWDKPELLNLTANALFAAALVLALYVAAVAVAQLPVFPLREVRVAAAPAHISAAELEGIVKRDLRGNFFTVDLAATRAALERLSWVRKVDVRRRWPDRLEVAFEEHVPLARWGARGMVNNYGEVFEGAYDGALPVFNGPPGTAKEIAIQYEYFRRSLAAIGQIPAQVSISQRRAWQVRLESGLTLELGREQIEARLSRFVASYERTVGKLGRRLDYVDLRYSNGFAARIPELRHEKARTARGAS